MRESPTSSNIYYLRILSKQKPSSKQPEVKSTMQQKYSQMHISCLPRSRSLILGLYVRAYIYDEQYCILFHFFTSTSSREFFIVEIRHFFFIFFSFFYKRWNPPLKSLLFFAGREKEKFCFLSLFGVCLSWGWWWEGRKNYFFIFFIATREMRFRGMVMEDNVLKSNASE